MCYTRSSWSVVLGLPNLIFIFILSFFLPFSLCWSAPWWVNWCLKMNHDSGTNLYAPLPHPGQGRGGWASTGKKVLCKTIKNSELHEALTLARFHILWDSFWILPRAPVGKSQDSVRSCLGRWSACGLGALNWTSGSAHGTLFIVERIFWLDFWQKLTTKMNEVGLSSGRVTVLAFTDTSPAFTGKL